MGPSAIAKALKIGRASSLSRASRPDPDLWTLGRLDVGPVGRLSLSALVVIGTRHCWRGMVKKTTRSTERSNARRNRRFLNFLSGSRARAVPLGSSTSYARWDNGHEDNSPENSTCRTIAVVNLRQGSKWLVNWSLVREPRYADSSQSVSQKTGFSGWPKRKTGRVCRTSFFAASQSKNRLPPLCEFTSAFHKIVVTLIANDDAAVRVKPPGPVRYNFKKKAALTFNEARRALIRAGLLLRKLFFGGCSHD